MKHSAWVIGVYLNDGIHFGEIDPDAFLSLRHRTALSWAYSAGDDRIGCDGLANDRGNLRTILRPANQGWAVGLVAEVITPQGLGPLEHTIFADDLLQLLF